ncbi:ribosome-associated ATPase/putative transporter RbbA [Aquabacterium sp.]|uniref:ribosome-associated ATPase/putative transporter RbbA n=1 Tax=Aquabacterium sp. TaxID=1872578 RepID=UPI002488A07E|nr:ribosome-associated ATPase/putative transporter RbbA [Aquabacterium sp.]MDI1261354.1 ribosome-associated ATPase/putative transporter RbbA [Aquabacterium sp.]
MDQAIVIDRLSHRYGPQLALDAVSMSLPTGRTIGLVGPDGVGKSTLLGLISGVKKLQSGSLQVLGGDLRNRRFRQMLAPRVAFMAQGLGRNLYRSLSVYDNIDFAARLFGVPAAERGSRIHALMEATGLGPFPNRPAGKLSGGMKQKVSLCCALVHNPDLLVLDEPTTGVDPLSRRQFWALVQGLRTLRPHMTVLVATAYMEEAERFEHLVAMDEGRVLVCAPTIEVLEQTRSSTLEEAYVKLSKKGDAAPLVIPPLPAHDGPPAMEALGLTRRFGDFVAARDVSFCIPRGEIFGFLGSNGCGKTTTMKMLTGLLDITEGSAKLLGEKVDAGDLRTRLHIGYMSQLFSLYEELSVRQNLALHARLYRMDQAVALQAIEESLDTFELREHAEVLPSRLSLGIRQRLQLAAACLHKPEVLILDEPTSGVDPAARDMFWRHMIRMSRQEGVTLFVSTHFMNEAQRCDRISLMHHGRVLAVGAPNELCERQGCETLEQAFIDYLEADSEAEHMAIIKAEDEPAPSAPLLVALDKTSPAWRAWLVRMWAYARREATELRHDTIRLAFALIGPLIVLCAGTWGMSFDVDSIRFSVLDRDQTTDSRRLIEHFEGSSFFAAQPPLNDPSEIESELRASRSWLVIDIPPGFGRDLIGGRQPEVGYFVDGATLVRAAAIANGARAVSMEHALAFARSVPGVELGQLPVQIAPRMTYNQGFLSKYAFAPSMLMLALTLIPSMLTALGVVREKEMGTIVNLYTSPGAIGEFLVGKQLPYVALTMLSYSLLLPVLVWVLGIPITGSVLALTLGALAYAFAVTALGLLISAFVQTQVAAQFLTAILCVILTTNFAGLLSPVATLSGGNYWIGVGFPASWFQSVSLGVMTKGWGLQWAQLGPACLAMMGFAAAYLLLARLFVSKQEV